MSNLNGMDDEVDEISEDLDSLKFFTAEGSSDEDTFKTAVSSSDLSPDKSSGGNQPESAHSSSQVKSSAHGKTEPQPPSSAKPAKKSQQDHKPSTSGKAKKAANKSAPQAPPSARAFHLEVHPIPTFIPPNFSEPSEPEWTEVMSRRERRRTMSGGKKNANGMVVSLPFFTVHPALWDYKDCFFDWISPSKPFTKETVETIASVLVSKYGRLTDEMLTKEVKVMPIETTANHLIMTFCYILLKDLGAAYDTLELVAKIISLATQIGCISTGHLEGLVYLFSGLEAHKQTVTIEMMGGDDKDQDGVRLLRKYIDGVTPYSKLTAEAKVAIKGVRAFFLGSSRVLPEQIRLLQEIVEQEPKVVEWRVIYHYVLRLARRERNRRERPQPVEKETVLKCLELAQTNVSVKLAVCLYLSDVIRLPEIPDSYSLLELSNGVTFHNFEEVTRYVRRVAEEVLLEMEHSTKINLCLADIFTANVPYKFRDSKFAKRCFQNALHTNPKSSKANHKFGLFLLTQENNPVGALEYIRKAYSVDTRNFSALIDMLQVMMGDLTTHETEIRELFEEHKNNEKWLPSQRGSLHALNAIFYFMKGLQRECIISWVKARKTSPEGLYSLEMMQFNIKRYKWDESLVTPVKLKDLAHDFVSSKLSPECEDLFTSDYRLCIEEALKFLERCVDRMLRHGSANSSRGRGRGRGQGRGNHNGTENSNWRGQPGGNGGFRGNNTRGTPNRSVFRSNWQPNREHNP